MDLNMLASIGEFAGAVAVVISVLYLSIQVRHNSKTVSTAALQALNDTANQALAGMAEPGIAPVITKGLDGLEPLDDVEVFQFSTHITILMLGLQNNFCQHQAGLITDPVWERRLDVAKWWVGFKGVEQAMALIGRNLEPEFHRLSLTFVVPTARSYSDLLADAAQQGVEPDVE